ncbi:MAG: NADH-quinone oxidoreductase subunit A [Candidatus Kryptonium sp.]
MLSEYLPIFILMLFALAFASFMVLSNRLLGPKKPNPEKLSTYESGMEPIRSARDRFSVKFYLIAMLFIIFDIEIVFLYPWAVTFDKLGVLGYIEMFLFIFVLLIGYIYIIKKGALRWE